MEFTDEKFESLKLLAQEQYKQIGKVYSPYLKLDVHFNSEGFEHILFKKWDVPRARQDQYMRLKLLPLSVKIIAQSRTLQEYFEQRQFVRTRPNNKWTKEMKLVKYYIFSSVVSSFLVKIIVRHIEGGQPHFYSIIPKWVIHKDRDGKTKRLLHRGNPEED
jgi:hypothetical protein